MDSWISAHWRFEPHRAQVLRSDDETRAIAIRLPSGEELQEHQVHERTTCSSSTARSRLRRMAAA